MSLPPAHGAPQEMVVQSRQALQVLPSAQRYAQPKQAVAGDNTLRGLAKIIQNQHELIKVTCTLRAVWKPFGLFFLMFSLQSLALEQNKTKQNKQRNKQHLTLTSLKGSSSSPPNPQNTQNTAVLRTGIGRGLQHGHHIDGRIVLHL